MKKFIWISVLLLSFISVTGSYAQNDSDPVISTFNSSLTTVDRDALTQRSARIPVSWQADNRPLLANLIFEQILPNDSVINVELPRIIPWVNSTGNGITAPILPSNSATAITLRIRLTNIVTSETYDEKTITLAIANNGSGAGGTDKIPTIKQFQTDFTGKLNQEALAAGNIQLPVSWLAINRPVTANLIFEQILPDSTIKNVELPRNNPRVNSEGRGIIAPVSPGENIKSIVVRVRLIDLLYGRIYDQRIINIPIAEAGDNTPGIDIFSTTRSFLDRNHLKIQTELVDVAWSVSNRPANSNLVFEQILPDGRIFNAELPRDFTYVASTGNGVVKLRNPGTGINDVTFRVRLIDTTSNVTLDTATLSLPILQPDTDTTDGTLPQETVITVSGDACYQSPFPSPNGVTIGQTALSYSDALQLFTTREATAGTTYNAYLQQFDVLEGPYCTYIENSDQRGQRLWKIKSQAGGVEGWAYEYIEIAQNRLFVTLVDDATSDAGGNRIVTGQACYEAPFPPDYGLAVGNDARILTISGGASLDVYTDKDGTKKADLQAGDTLTLEEGPYCIRTGLPNITYHNRQWRITSGEVSGWVYEYRLGQDDTIIRLIAGIDEADNPAAQIIAVDVTPDTITPANINDGATATITWQTQNATKVGIASGEFQHETLEVNGSLTIPISELDTSRNPVLITFTAENDSFNYDFQDTEIQVETAVNIESFTVSPDSDLIPGNVVTLSWNINGALPADNPASIWWTPEHYRYTLNTVTTVESNSGSINVTIPESAYGERVFTLYAYDETGTRHEATTTITVDCLPVEFFISDPTIQANHCVHPALTTDAAYQHFENGMMVWTEHDNMIYVIYNNGVAARHSDNWNGTAYTIEETPPDGLAVPERGFGYLWQSREDIRNALGWASSTENAFTTRFQATRAYGRYQTTYGYFTIPDGRTIRLKHETVGSTWQPLR